MVKTCVKTSWIFQFTVQILLKEKQFSPYWLFKAIISAINGLTIFKINLCLSCVNIIFEEEGKWGNKNTKVFF